MMNIKCVVVGDDYAGKRSLLFRYTTNEPYKEYDPTVFDNWIGNVMVDGRPVNLGLWDTSGQEGYDRLRPLTYPQTGVFVIVFDIGNMASFENITTKWWPELQYHEPDVPILLVGTNIEAREGNKKKSTVSRLTAEHCCRTINAYKYVECSLLTLIGVKEVFDDAIRAFFNYDVTNAEVRLLSNAYDNKVTSRQLHRYIQSGRDVNFFEPGRRMCALWYMAKHGNVRHMAELIDAKANVMCVSATGMTALHIAAKRGRRDCVKLLLIAKANPKEKNSVGKTPLDLAIAQNKKKVLELFFMDMDVLVQEDTGDTPDLSDDTSDDDSSDSDGYDSDGSLGLSGDEYLDEVAPHFDAFWKKKSQHEEVVVTSSPKKNTDEHSDVLNSLSVEHVRFLQQLEGKASSASYHEAKKQALLQSHPALLEFYWVLHMQLHSKWLAGSLFKSGLIMADTSGVLGYLGMFSDMFEIPIIGSALKSIDITLQTAGLSKLAYIAHTPSEIESICDVIAWHCVQALEKDLRAEKLPVKSTTDKLHKVTALMKQRFAHLTDQSKITKGLLGKISVNKHETMGGERAMLLMGYLVTAFFNDNDLLGDFSQLNKAERCQRLIRVLPDVPNMQNTPEFHVTNVPMPAMSSSMTNITSIQQSEGYDISERRSSGTQLIELQVQMTALREELKDKAAVADLSVMDGLKKQMSTIQNHVKSLQKKMDIEDAAGEGDNQMQMSATARHARDKAERKEDRATLLRLERNLEAITLDMRAVQEARALETEEKSDIWESDSDPFHKLQSAKRMLDAGLISQIEYDQLKKQVLKKMQS